ncbi:MAG: ORF6N domain-containing protein [Sediminibacterium sp.]|nr:ORF6N domain-containing protein [Sediminibacterium sp.]
MSKDIIISKKQIEDLIFTFRGIQIMTDRDLAHLYQVETRVLNQAVKRNIQRFPPHFRFQLNLTEFENWKSQIVISNNDNMGLRRPPFVFTEQGVAMLSAVLNSQTAILVSIQIIDAFVKMRHQLIKNTLFNYRLDTIELKQLQTDQKFEQVFKALEKNTTPTQGVFFDGQVFDAYQLVSKIIRTAKKNIFLIDNYIDETTLTHLTKKSNNVQVFLLTKDISKQLILDTQKANEQYGNFKTITFTHSHDRFLIIDEQEVYHLGASLKDLGKKWFAFSKLKPLSVQGIINKIKEVI